MRPSQAWFMQLNLNTTERQTVKAIPHCTDMETFAGEFEQ